MLCVIAKIDKCAAEKLKAIQRTAVSESAARPIYGHITIAAYVGDDEAGFIAFCKALIDGATRFTVKYTRLVALEETSIVVAAAEKADALGKLYRCIAEEYGDSLNQWTRTDEMWLPHTTLLHDPDMDMIDMRDICRKMESRFEPFTAVVESIEFSRVTEAGYEIVGGIELQG